MEEEGITYLKSDKISMISKRGSEKILRMIRPDKSHVDYIELEI